MNLTNLHNIAPLEVNNSLINETNEIIPSIISNSNSLTDGYFGLGIMTVIFVVLLLILMTDQDVFSLKFSTALAASSGITLLVGIIMLVSDIAASFTHVMWYAIIFAISLVVVYYDKS